jgi:hypothetical protein
MKNPALRGFFMLVWIWRVEFIQEVRRAADVNEYTQRMIASWALAS